MYKKARSGLLPGFTGIGSDYEPPVKPDLILNAGEETEEECMEQLIHFLNEKGIIPKELIQELYKPEVQELFVFDANQQQLLKEKARNSPSVELSLVDLQWVQVRHINSRFATFFFILGFV